MKPDSLQKALKFTDADLKANRAGHLSAAQLEHFRREKRRSDFIVLLITVSPVFCAVGYGIRVILYHQNDLSVLYTFGFLLCIVWLIWYIMRKISQNLQSIINSPKVEAVQGVLWREKKRASGNSLSFRYYVGIGEESFRVLKQVYGAFVQNEVYTIYYTSKGKLMLSAEKLAE